MGLLLLLGVVGIIGGLTLVAYVWANWDELGPEPKPRPTTLDTDSTPEPSDPGPQ